MGSKEIRLRKQRLNPGRIARHRDYAALMRRHRRGLKTKQLLLVAIYIVIVLLLLLLSYMAIRIERNREGKQPRTNVDTLTTTDRATLDTLDLKVLKFDSLTFKYIFPQTYTSTGLKDEEIIECEKLLKSYIADYNEAGIKRFNEMSKKYPNQLNSKDFTIELKDYGRQYVAVVSDKGEKIVYVNCFCNPTEFSYRDKELVEVEDGGNCYFQFKVNLTTKQLFDFMENGVA